MQRPGVVGVSESVGIGGSIRWRGRLRKLMLSRQRARRYADVDEGG